MQRSCGGLRTEVKDAVQTAISGSVSSPCRKLQRYFSAFLAESFDSFEPSDLPEVSDFCESSDFDFDSFLEDAESPLEELEDVAEVFLG